MTEFRNELAPELLGIHALNSFAMHNSSSRSVMFSSHFTQRLVINGADEKRIQTGVEKEFGKYTFSISMPADGKIIKVIDRYPKGVGYDSLPFNPETIVIYENDATKEIDYFSIPYYASYHQFFGFKYSIKETVNLLRPGVFIPKGVIFADSPAVGENGSFNYGINANVAFMSVPAVAEDGVLISNEFLDKLKFKIYENRVVQFGSECFPLNLYGNTTTYKPFPEIGEYIREDGVLMMLRDYESNLTPVEMSIYDTMEPDFIFDKGVYVRGGKGKVIDIKVVSNNAPNKMLPETMTSFIERYRKAYSSFHSNVVELERQIRIDRKKKFGVDKANISPRLHRLIVESMAITNHPSTKNNQTLNLLHRKNPIDEYRIEFVIEYEITPGIGFKITGQAGDKGVICDIVPADHLPIDEDGNRADIVMDEVATVNRMNLGRLYEHYFNAAIRDTGKRVRSMLNLTAATPELIASLDENLVNSVYDYILNFYKICSTKQYEFYLNLPVAEKLSHIASVVNNGIYLYMPIDNDKNVIESIKTIEASGVYKPTYGPVQYRGNSGNVITTKSNVRVAPLYIMLLEKIADEWSSVATGKLQHFGVLSTITKSEKFASPYRCTPVRTIGETEGRIFAGYCGREAIAEMMDRSNSPMTQRNMVWNILDATTPGNIYNTVDRNYTPLGASKPIQLVKHMFTVAGFTAKYEPEEQ